MDFDTGRRRFLELAGTGTALSLAGCSALQGDTESHNGPESSAEGTAATEKRQQVTVALQVDQQQLQQRQQEISSELRSGNISRTEARQQYQTAQQELLSNAATSFTDRVESSQALTIVDHIDQFGVFLVEGAPATLLETLSFEAVSALLSVETFEQAKQQQTNATATTTDTTVSN